MNLAETPQQRQIAVVAHFDPSGSVSEHIVLLLKDLKRVFSDIIIVSTSLDPAERRLDEFGTLLVRPNTGYDFASWAFGIEYARKTFVFDDVTELAIVNDSFYLLRENVTADAFEAMDKNAVDVWGLTASHEITFHLQSFFVVFRTPALKSGWFDRFWSTIWEAGDRAFVIRNYELRLTRELQQQGLSCAAFWDAHTKPTIAAIDKNLNPTHLHWRLVAEDVGIAKGELVRVNPHALDLRRLNKIADPLFMKVIEQHSSDRNTRLIKGGTALEEASWFAARSRRAIAVHVHLYYPDLIDEIMGVLRSICVPYDLYITVCDAASIPALLGRIKGQHRDARVLLVPNIGRDIGPFLSLMHAGVFEPYAMVCKLHSKKSTYSARGGEWRQQLMHALLGSSGRVLDMVAAFHRRPELGIVGPARSFVQKTEHWGANREQVTRLARRIDGIYADTEVPLAFFAGSMFWFRPQALAPIGQLALSEANFGIETGAQDGTLAHAIERLTCISAWSAGYVVADSEDLGGTLHADGHDTSYIPVL